MVIHRKCSFRQREIKAPVIPQGGKVSLERNEMENSDKLEIRHRGGGKEFGGCQAGRQRLKWLVFLERT